MHIQMVRLKGFRNFLDAEIRLNASTLMIGANDVGKTNFMYALRLLLDRSLPDISLDPCDTDFHVDVEGSQVNEYQIEVHFADINKDAVLANLKGFVSDSGEAWLRYVARKGNLRGRFFMGASELLLEEINGRQYLRFLNLKYVQSQRDLRGFIRGEKKTLLRLSKQMVDENEAEKRSDSENTEYVSELLEDINQRVRDLNYVKKATDSVNEELEKISHHHAGYKVRLDAGPIETSQFIDNLELTGNAHESRVGLGGDGRNNQILMALWKSKEREQDLDNECVIFCVEEPEAHLHPHQQRKLSEYLVSNLPGQVIVTSHSPQIASRFTPDSIVRLKSENGATRAASGGCSKCVEEAWLDMGYRMSILPAESFFAEMVLLVEGPSEELFYHEFARQLGFDLDRFNLSVLSVDGVDFDVYVAVLNALEISWALRTDHDIFRVPRSSPPMRRLAGLNRARKICRLEPYQNIDEDFSEAEILELHLETSQLVNPYGVFIADKDLETDLVGALVHQCLSFTGTRTAEEAVDVFQSRKAVNMYKFLQEYGSELGKLPKGSLRDPLDYCRGILS